MKVLVTGATGAIGIPLVRELKARGHSVTILIRRRKESLLSTLLQEMANPDFIIGDVTQPLCGMTNFNLDFDVVIHAAGLVQYHESKREETLLANVDGTRNVLDLASFLRVKKFVDISTCYVAGRRQYLSEDEVGRESDTHNPYELSKIRAEALVRMLGARSLILRLGTVIGNANNGAIVNIGGYAGFTSLFWKLRDRILKFPNNPFLVSLNPATTLNMVTNEWVTKTIVDAAMSEMTGTVHLGHPNPVDMGRLYQHTFHGDWDFPVICSKADFEPTALYGNRLWLNLQEKISAHVEYFGPYVRRDTTFGHERVRQVPNYTPPPEITNEVIYRQVQYMDQVLFAKEQPQVVAAE